MNRLVIFSLLAASLVACKDDVAEESVAAEPAPVTAEDPAKKPRRTMNEVMEATTRAIEATKEAETGSTDCERAYNGLTALAKTLTKEFGAKRAPRTVDHDGFIELCEGLSAEAQKCLVPSYVLEHRDECRDVKNDLGPEFRSKLGALTKHDGEPAKPAPDDAP
jgi:hypothetical protein